MATGATRTAQSVGKEVIVTWPALGNGETGDPVYVGDLSELVAQATGAGTATLQGSNDGVNFAALATPVSLVGGGTSSPITPIVGNPAYLRPVGTVGTSAVTVVGKRYR